MVQAIVGANWGDEGKGKITDYLAENADVVVRFQGTPLLTIMAGFHYTYFQVESSIRRSLPSWETAWRWIFRSS